MGYSDAGGLTRFGAYVETPQTGSRSSDRHWHEEEDEFLYMLSDAATVIEEDGAYLLRPSGAACWPAGAPCTYLIFGTRMARDIAHHPEVGRILHDEDGTWRLRRTDGGAVIEKGRIEQVRPLTWWEAKAHQVP